MSRARFALPARTNVKSMLLAVCESGSDLRDPHQSSGCRLSVVAVQPSSGQILWDEFQDDSVRNELERALQVRCQQVWSRDFCLALSGPTVTKL